MKLERIVGLFIVSLSILVASIQISMAHIAMYIDELTKETWNEFYMYIPKTLYIAVTISMLIGIYLIFYKQNNN